MGAQRRGNHMDVGEGTQGEGVKITSWVQENKQVTGRYRRVTEVSLSLWDDSVSSLILERIVRLWKGCWHLSGWWPSRVWTPWHISSFRVLLGWLPSYRMFPAPCPVWGGHQESGNTGGVLWDNMVWKASQAWGSFSLKASRRANPAQTSISCFWAPEWWANKCLL